MARAVRGAEVNRLQRHGGSALEVQVQRGSGGSVRLKGSHSSPVVGRKYIRLLPPSATEALAPHSQDSRSSNASQIDIRCPDLAHYPAYAQAPYMDCILKSGEMLYIPPRWWHYVQSLDISCSVSFWWG
ncbi:hypothetical protein CYMTET_5413 [Cymbomonas tetramitiformis]|uniref:JmjC domain-containing protein n=1 Tax=Cymbomonas tetramitiformis TaxID=36881 RepID=A0AAE0GZ47_9CHLO|nr:hypothetical protein CYMTET_5413 [Cymbomonas tetramitiformis]